MSGLDYPRPRTDTSETEGNELGRGADAWEQLSSMLSSGDVSRLAELYSADAIYLEPYNPPHRGNLLIEAYLKDWLAGKEDVEITSHKVLEGDDGASLGVEWTISYTAAGRRWSDLPRASFFTLGDDGRIEHHRDYT